MNYREPLFTNDCIPKTKIIEKIFTVSESKLYYKGELNGNGERHGIGLWIIPFKQIYEAHFQNGAVSGELRYIYYDSNRCDNIQFKRFAKCYWQKRIGYTGRYQFYDQNGSVFEEGYLKNSQCKGEQKRYLPNSIEYASIIYTGEPLKY